MNFKEFVNKRLNEYSQNFSDKEGKTAILQNHKKYKGEIFAVPSDMTMNKKSLKDYLSKKYANDVTIKKVTTIQTDFDPIFLGNLVHMKKVYYQEDGKWGEIDKRNTSKELGYFMFPNDVTLYSVSYKI